ncbi:DUF7010 family protein [Flagellimonas flava]|uniref:DUF308 domain-containing protein n=1 Tax=Flagellimonas flava TaxID=570519 RepID=A0A1M5KY81_9FLAO|nr:hypothetical protein [Allomuricauda flava]SHG57665.1 hypothetical protein SAMN04488116_1848 [Allomuricauda flava]
MISEKNSLEEQRTDFSKGKFMATPLAGLIVWALVGLAGLVLPVRTAVWVLFLSTGSIVYLAMFISRYTGEHFLAKNKPKNEFDTLFFYTVGQAVLVYAIAIPFFLVDHTSLPMTVGILLGSMWIPFSWIIKHWVGLFHAITRTILVLVLWYVFPELRFVVIPFAIMLVYFATLVILAKRPIPN